MKVAFFDTHRFDRESFSQAQLTGYEITFFEPRLNAQTAALATGHDAVCSFVNDHLCAETLHTLKILGVKVILLRCAGFNHVDLVVAGMLDITVLRVPEYSPHAVAEHAVALVLALNRQIHRAHDRVREWNFSLDGLVGFDLYGKTVGIIGTGRIGRVAARIFHGFGCRVLAYDPQPDPSISAELGFHYGSLEDLYKSSDVISLHVPLTPDTRHMVDTKAFEKMKRGVMIVNTGRGALIDSIALISALKTEQVGSAGLDVYEEEEGIFFEDLSSKMLLDDVLARLLTFPNVLVTSHQAFLTREALNNIVETTLANLTAFSRGESLVNRVTVDQKRDTPASYPSNIDTGISKGCAVDSR
jgi:D-lactate dehydrogenase